MPALLYAIRTKIGHYWGILMSYLDAFIGDTDDEIFDELIMHLIDALDAETEEDRDMSVKMLSMGLKALIAAASSNSS